jgi:pectinesterase
MMMFLRHAVTTVIAALVLCASAVHAMPADASEYTKIIVAQDGSGDFTTIQEAINSVPHHNMHTVTIIIKKGTYHEKLYITTSYLTLAGEDRDSTRIVYAELRKNWNQRRFGNDWGSAVVNIDSTVTDLTITNMTIYNNYGSLYHTEDHQFAIRGGGTRVMLLGCNVIADGGDTVSLWNRQTGMYYHADCYFEGGVDFVCPRGWCYITDSKFYGRNLSASIWHDGSTNKDEKFVIRNSYFDGVKGFPLGRNHRDGQFFLLDCEFSANMADTPIYHPGSAPTPLVWGPRYYYWNCHRETGDFSWFKDNLKDAEGSPDPSIIDAKWTFAGAWDPEASIPNVVPWGIWRPKSIVWPVPAERK